MKSEGAQWLSGRVLDSRPKGRGFEPHRRHCVVVLEKDTFILAEYRFNPGRPAPVKLNQIKQKKNAKSEEHVGRSYPKPEYYEELIKKNRFLYVFHIDFRR